MTDPYIDYVADFAELLGRKLPEPDVKKAMLKANHVPERLSQKPCALMLTPHPDDECLTGALPLRLRQEAGWQIINVAITLGSKLERKAERWAELTRACDVLGFDVMQAVPNGFPSVRREVRETQPQVWENMVKRVAEIIALYKPQAVFLPHERDKHYTHIGTHLLAMDALAKMPEEFACHVVQTEWWHPHERPNCMIGLNNNDAARLLKALSCHVGEVRRNPYHQRFPAFLIDNVRRGSERILGEGAKGAAIDLAILYRLDRWRDGKLESVERTSLEAPDTPINGVF